ncbi:MAG: hypothetical protein KGV51_06925 [Moraxellaceae bacterium]|nr:hypothetical protein [Moraxellaceae bacterium]
MNKKLGTITTHVPPEIAIALKLLADDENKSPSEYVRDLIIDNLTTTYSQAKNTANRLSILENYQN